MDGWWMVDGWMGGRAERTDGHDEKERRQDGRK